MIDLVITHSPIPGVPLGPWKPLATLGDPWQPLATCLKMTILGVTLKFFLWPPFTQSHGWLRERSSIKKKVYCGTPYSPPLPNRFHPYFHSVFFCASKHWIWQKLRFTQGLARSRSLATVFSSSTIFSQVSSIRHKKYRTCLFFF